MPARRGFRSLPRIALLRTRAILLITDLDERVIPSDKRLRALGLTPAETRLSLLLANGMSLRESADHAGIAFNTARQHLKSVFAKTGTHRQGELVALLQSMR